ncbi:Large eukaryotic DNA virus major capsid protein [uncultured virus]|nr:Large eukaryotic DNA virus major capsid protein [uncultured virus]
MSGGLIQLVAFGLFDIFLTKDPEITFFKIVYRRNTNFSLEVIPQYFNNPGDFGKKISCTISKNGDLVRNIHLVIILPNIPQFRDENNSLDPVTKFAWVRKIGYAIIKSIEIEIDNELIDKHYGDWLNIWYELSMTNKKNIKKLLGDVKELVEFSNGKKSYKLYIPLQFWFNKFVGLALPLICLQSNNVKINLEINDIKNCYITTPTHFINIEEDFVNFKPMEYIEQQINGVKSIARFIHFDILNKRLYLWRISNNGFLSNSLPIFDNKFLIKGLESNFVANPQINSREHLYKNFNDKNINLRGVYLLVEYIFLDNNERIKFLNSKHEYLIEQIQYSGEKIIDSFSKSFKINFYNPCKEIIWVSQLNLAQNQRINDTFNYSDSLITFKNLYKGKNIIEKETILLNDQERISLRDSDYFTKIQVYQNHLNSTNNLINVYSFGLFPEKYQPSGSVNLSKIDNKMLKIITNSNINKNNAAKLRIYGITYNILRIFNGASKLVFNSALSNL